MYKIWLKCPQVPEHRETQWLRTDNRLGRAANNSHIIVLLDDVMRIPTVNNYRDPIFIGRSAGDFTRIALDTTKLGGVILSDNDDMFHLNRNAGRVRCSST